MPHLKEQCPVVVTAPLLRAYTKMSEKEYYQTIECENTPYGGASLEKMQIRNF